MQTQISSPLEPVRDIKEVRGSVNAGGQPVIPSQPAGAVGRAQPHLELTLRLQTSLEVEWVMDQFMKEIRTHVPYDGYRYSLAQPVLEMKAGREQGHSCTYNLSIEGFNLGKVVLYRGRKFVESELVLLESLFGSLVYPLRNAIMYRKATLQAHQDALTGVNNRAMFDVTLTREMHLAQRNEQDFALLVIDIDHFKKVNDTYGHSAGDEVIKSVAKCIQATIRHTDQVFRFGGEEFVALLNNADCDTAFFIAERILDCIRNSTVMCGDNALKVSASIGVSCLKGGDTNQSLFKRADDALYQAKSSGRNQAQYL
jgi:diguanylate cyclase (GGDEF)-like protein